METVLVALLLGFAGAPARASRSQDAKSLEAAATSLESRGAVAAEEVGKELRSAAIRLPLAALLGAALAWRPRRRGSPPRRSAVVETQVVLAVVGAVIMQVVGASLARAFGIVGVASLIRYRSKISDPRDAVVMLSALAVGLAAGSGLYALALFSTMFVVLILWFVEGFEHSTRIFELSLKLGEEAPRLRPAVEQLLKRFDFEFELRGTAEDGFTYLVTAPHGSTTDRISKALAALATDGKAVVEWNEKGKGQA